MNKVKKSKLLGVLLGCILVGCASCDEKQEVPQIESVWRNMTSEPVREVMYAYPEQTLCLRGSGFGNLQKLIVNGTEIEILNTLIYDTENSITFKLPSTVNTSSASGNYSIQVVTLNGEATYAPFIVKAKNERPVISRFSTTTLVPGRTLTIAGSNFEGVTEVWLPLTFEEKVRCKFDPEQENTSTSLFVIIPDGVDFAQGQCEVVMQKEDEQIGLTYTEHVYSEITNFS